MDQFQRKVAEQRAKHVEALMQVPDGDALKHAQIRNVIRGLDEASKLYQSTLAKIDEE